MACLPFRSLDGLEDDKGLVYALVGQKDDCKLAAFGVVGMQGLASLVDASLVEPSWVDASLVEPSSVEPLPSRVEASSGQMA